MRGIGLEIAGGLWAKTCRAAKGRCWGKVKSILVRNRAVAIYFARHGTERKAAQVGGCSVVAVSGQNKRMAIAKEVRGVM